MTDREFEDKARKTLALLNELQREAMRTPTYNKVNSLVSVVHQVTQITQSPVCNKDSTLSNLGLDSCESIYGTKESREEYNEHLTRIASNSYQWAVNVSIYNGFHYTFPRSKANDSELETLLIKLKLGKNQLAKPTQPKRTAGTREHTFMNFILLQISEIQRSLDRAKRDTIDLANTKFEDPFKWLETTNALQPLSNETLEEWLNVIIAKLNSETANRITPNTIYWLANSYMSNKKDKGGGTFIAFFKIQLRANLKKILG
tara:strand:- start:7879 stop:8658 length:780 start_codon:yes stop_codon:yes gene_type:complete